jgi:hypothetical protein
MRTLLITLLALLTLAPTAPAHSQRQVPAEALLGFRVESLRKSWPAASLVVIAESPAAYLSAIAEWSLERRFPVLIDDGTPAAREHIARFMRAFDPERVRLYTKDKPAPQNTKTAVARAIASAWGAEGADEQALRALWSELGHVPPGLILAAGADPAWPAAAALAAGRGQPIVWTDPVPGRLGGKIAPEHLTRLQDAAEAAARTSPWSWNRLGDQLDALTICLSAPSKVDADDDRGPRALSDVLGRTSAGERWAWTGVIHGSEAESAYRAMCSLFLQPESAWLFNGYSQGGNFAAYAVEGAAELLSEAGISLLNSGRPAGGRYDWTLEAMSGVDAQLIFVNSSGQRRWFDLAPGRASGVDVPMLLSPAAVHFIHSFSAQNIDDRRSIARAWLDQGAFLYVGSVHEPFLQAFVPPSALAERLLAPAPFAPSARQRGPAWKVHIIGDPLYTLGPDAPSFDGAIDFDGLRDVQTTLAAALAERDYDRAARLLAMLGRDEDLANLARAVASDDAGALGPELAEAGLLAAVRLGQVDLAIELHGYLPPDRRMAPIVAHPLWHLAEPLLTGEPDAQLARFVGRVVRQERYERDATLAARALSRVDGSEAAAALLARLMDGAPSEGVRRALADELTRY